MSNNLPIIFTCIITSHNHTVCEKMLAPFSEEKKKREKDLGKADDSLKVTTYTQMS